MMVIQTTLAAPSDEFADLCTWNLARYSTLALGSQLPRRGGWPPCKDFEGWEKGGGRVF